MTNPVSTAELVSPGGQHSPVVVASQRMLAFDENGSPYMVNKNIETVNRNIVDRVGFSALLLPYKGEKVPDPSQDPEDDLPVRYVYQLDPEYEGLTNLEVASIKAAQKAASGDTVVLKMLLERSAGKAVDKSLNVSTTMDYQSFCESLQPSGDSLDIEHML